LRDDDVAEILQRVHHADAAHDVGLLAARDAAAAGVGGVVVDGADDLVDATP
jgi:ribosomal protein L18